MLCFKNLFLKPLFIIIYEWKAKIDFYDESGYWPCEESLEMIHAQSALAWRFHVQRQQGMRIMKRKFKVKAVHQSRYYAIVEAKTEEEAMEIADTHGIIDDNFWLEDYGAWEFNVLDALELNEDND